MKRFHSLWRIATDSAAYESTDLSGEGARLTGGRWNHRGTAMIYSSKSIALACLETLVHLAGHDPLPLNRYLVRLDVPAAIWQRRALVKRSTLRGWDALPAGKVSLDWGTQWANRGRELLAEVPSIVVPEEKNVLVNPLHPDLDQLTVTKLRRWSYDFRLA